MTAETLVSCQPFSKRRLVEIFLPLLDLQVLAAIFLRVFWYNDKKDFFPKKCSIFFIYRKWPFFTSVKGHSVTAIFTRSNYQRFYFPLSQNLIERRGHPQEIALRLIRNLSYALVISRYKKTTPACVIPKLIYRGWIQSFNGGVLKI